MAVADKTFRVFVSSTFSDLKAEREALQERVFPRLRDLCTAHGAHFQAIDLRWGVSQEASLDQQTMNICLDEIRRCHRVTPRPNFLVLLGDRYGWRPLPPRIQASEFETLLKHMSARESRLLCWRQEQPAGGKGWYRRDDNAIPAEYRLQPRELDLSRCSTRDDEEAARAAEAEEWRKIENDLRQALVKAAEKASLTEEQRYKYEVSATAQEIALGALQVDDPSDKVLCCFRTLKGLPDRPRPRNILAYIKDRCEEHGCTLNSSAIQCLESIQDLPHTASPRTVRNLISRARAEILRKFQADADLALLESWLKETIAYDYQDLDDDWLLDMDAAARIHRLKAELTRYVSDNVIEYQARWTGRGTTLDHIGSLPEDIEDCIALLDMPERHDTLCVSVWRRMALMVLNEIQHPTQLPPVPDAKLHLRPDRELDLEGQAHCDFANRLLRFFVGRDEPLAAIHDYIAGNDRRAFAVLGEGGAGKSAIMAKALVEAKHAFPEARIVYRFIGATPSSADGRSLLASVCQEISRRYGQDEDVPQAYNALVWELEKRMAPATDDRPLVLFLDALDQLSEAYDARRLSWLPRQLPEHVRVVVSNRKEVVTAAALARLEPEEHNVKPMTRREGEDLLDLWLADAVRKLKSEQHTKVLEAFEAKRSGSRPLYLKMAFEEARSWPSYSPAEELEPGIEGVIRKNLFGRLAREENHGQDLVACTVGYLAAARYGIAEDELMDVLSRDIDLYTWFLRSSCHLPSDLVAHAVKIRRSLGLIEGTNRELQAESWLHACIGDPGKASELNRFLLEILPRQNGPRLPVVLWSRIFFDLAPYLTERMGDGASLYSFYHRELQDTALQVFVKNSRARVLHGRLADYFRLRADPALDGSWTGNNVRGLGELPYHLTEAARWRQLHETLTDFRFLEHKAMTVGIEKTESDGEDETVYTGVIQLQQDFDHALDKLLIGGEPLGERNPLIVTAMDLGNGPVVRCPWCGSAHDVTKERRTKWLGQKISCPNMDCGSPLKVNPFMVDRKHGFAKMEAIPLLEYRDLAYDEGEVISRPPKRREHGRSNWLRRLWPRKPKRKK